VIWERPSRHPGLDVTVIAREDGGQPFLAYLHTPDRRRIVAVSQGRTPETTAHRVENLYASVLGRGVAVRA
jgi:hypothetical protein